MTVCITSILSEHIKGMNAVRMETPLNSFGCMIEMSVRMSMSMSMSNDDVVIIISVLYVCGCIYVYARL